MEMTKELRDEILTVLYEKCSNGEITVEEREELIQDATDEYLMTITEAATEKKEEQADSNEEKAEPDKKLSSKEKYDMLKDAVDKKCEAGEITEDFRDKLLEKASKEFLPEDK